MYFKKQINCFHCRLKICDKIHILPILTLFTLVGNALGAVAMSLVGPSPFLDLKATKDLTWAAMAVQGAAYGTVMVSTFARSGACAKDTGGGNGDQERDLDLYIKLTGLFVNANMYRFDLKLKSGSNSSTEYGL